jgi:hypothetical protein
MSTHAQIAANRANSQLSTGPRTEAGRAAVSKNNFRHGLVGAFMILSWENEEDFNTLFANFTAEYQPATETERCLVLGLARHHWLSERAVKLQHLTFTEGICDDSEQLGLYMRYQVTHQRAFHKCLNDLLKIAAAKAKTEIGFERQKQAAAAEIRKEEMHRARLRQIESRTKTGFEPQKSQSAALSDSERRLAELEREADEDAALMHLPLEDFKRELQKRASSENGFESQKSPEDVDRRRAELQRQAREDVAQMIQFAKSVHGDRRKPASPAEIGFESQNAPSASPEGSELCHADRD